jgi:hypothetical protein
MQDIFPIIFAERNVKAANAAKKAESSSNQHLKSTDAFFGGSPDFFIAVRTSRPHWIGSCHGLSHLDLQSLSNKNFSDFLILKLNGDLEIEPSEAIPQIEMTT